MDQLAMICLIGACILTPVLFGLYVGAVYLLGIGSVSIPGVARGELKPGRDWSTLSELSRRIGETLAAAISVLGALLGLLGFLLPWVELDIGSAGRILDLGGLTGTLNGIALLFQSFIAGVGLLSVEIEGVAILGTSLIAVSTFLVLIPIALGLSVLIALGMIAVPAGLLKTTVRRLARPLLFLSVLSLCLACTFFAGIQGTVGGIKIGGSGGLLGESFTIGVELANGFWVTVGGLILAFLGAVFAYSLAPRISAWARTLSALDQTGGDAEPQLDSQG